LQLPDSSRDLPQVAQQLFVESRACGSQPTKLDFASLPGRSGGFVPGFDLVAQALSRVERCLPLFLLFASEPTEQELGELVGLKTSFEIVADHVQQSIALAARRGRRR
jgi:hypothetical protein